MSFSGYISNETDHTISTSTRRGFEPDIPVPTSKMMNTQCGLNNSVNPGCVVEESTCRDYDDKTSVERVITVNSTTAAEVPVAQASAFPSPDITSDPQEINMSENQKIQPLKQPKKKKGRLAKLFLRCSCTSGNDNQEDSFETEPRDEEVPNSTTLDTSTDNIRNATPTEPLEVTSTTVLEIHSVPSQHVEYHTQTVTSSEYDATVLHSVSRQTGIVEVHNSSSIVQVTTQQHSECILSRSTDVLDREVVSVYPSSLLPTVVRVPQNVLLVDVQDIQPIEHTLAPPMESQDIKPSSSEICERFREYTINKDVANISIDGTRPCESPTKENDDVKSNRSTERHTHSLNTDKESKQIIVNVQRSSGASPAELTKAEDHKVVNNNKTSLREQSAATMKKVVDNIKTSLREQPGATTSTKADSRGETNPGNPLSQESHKRSDDDLMENVLKRRKDGTWYVLRRYKRPNTSRAAVCAYDDDLPVAEVNAAHNDVKSSEEDCTETKESEQKRMLRKTMNKYTDDMNLRTAKVAKRVHFSPDTNFNSPDKNEASTKRSEHSMKSLHPAASESTSSLNESHNCVKKVVYITRGTQTSPEGAVLSSKGLHSSPTKLDVVPKKESNEIDSSEKHRRHRRQIPSKNDHYQLMAEL